MPENIACYTVAATIAEKRSVWADRLLGYGLVPLDSALGQHEDSQCSLRCSEESQWIAYPMNHMVLLSSPEVNRQILHRLTPIQA